MKMMMAASTFIMIKAKVLTIKTKVLTFKAKSATKSKTKIATTKTKAKVGTIKARVATMKIQATATTASKVMNVPKMLKVMNMKKATGIPSTLGALITMICKTRASVKTVHRLSMLNTPVMQKITIHTTSMCKIRSTKRKKLNCQLTAKVVEVQVMAVQFLQVMAATIAMAVQVTSVVIVITGLLSKQMLMMIMDITAAITDDRQDGLR